MLQGNVGQHLQKGKQRHTFTIFQSNETAHIQNVSTAEKRSDKLQLGTRVQLKIMSLFIPLFEVISF